MPTNYDKKIFKMLLETLIKSGGYKKDDLTEIFSLIGRLASEDSMDYSFMIMDLIAGLEEDHANLSHEVRGYVMSTHGLFTSIQVKQSLRLSTRNEGKIVSKVISELIDENLVERTGRKHGEFRRIDDSFTALKSFDDEDTMPVNIKFPLDIDQYAKIFQTNIVCIAGEKDTGKTGFCLNFANLNRGNGHKVRYISSEFGAAELRERLEPMEVDPNTWIKEVEFGQFMRTDPQDAIDPDAINIVDFLENRDGQFFMVSEQITKIYQKLKTGIAVIALQKKIGSEYARGGELSAEKSRLYVTLSRQKQDNIMKNIATILHCKNRAIKEINANGYWCEYKLGGGHYFKRIGSWLPR